MTCWYEHCKRHAEKFQVKACGVCGVSTYCSKKCQKTDWRDKHKQECVKIRDSAASARALRQELSVHGVTASDLLSAYEHGRRVDLRLSLATPGRRTRQLERIRTGFDDGSAEIRGALRPFIHRILASVHVADADAEPIVPEEDREAVLGCIVIEALGIPAPGDPPRNEHAAVTFRTIRDMRLMAHAHSNTVLRAMEAADLDEENRDDGMFRVCLLAVTHFTAEGGYATTSRVLGVSVAFMYDLVSGEEQCRDDIARLTRGVRDGTLKFLEENTPKHTWIAV